MKLKQKYKLTFHNFIVQTNLYVVEYSEGELTQTDADNKQVLLREV